MSGVPGSGFEEASSQRLDVAGLVSSASVRGMREKRCSEMLDPDFDS